MATTRQAVIFDADDTLWKTQPLYQSVIREFYATLERKGFTPDEFRPLFASINRDLLKQIKLSSNRLERAMVATYETLCHRSGVMSQSSTSDGLIELARQVYIQAPEPMEYVHEVLSLLGQGFKLFLYSGGVEETQLARLTKLELAHYFQDRVFIVAKKDMGTLENILAAYDLDPKATWMIGNSPKFDVIPALQVGLSCIWMHTSFWKEELVDISISRVFGAFSLNEVANVLLYGNGFGPQGYVSSTYETQEMLSTLAGEIETGDLWVIGTSPKLDINPALGIGANPVWIPTAFDTDDVEPFGGSMFVAFSSEGAQQIIQQWSDTDLKLTKVIWRVREKNGDLGGSLVVD